MEREIKRERKREEEENVDYQYLLVKYEKSLKENQQLREIQKSLYTSKLTHPLFSSSSSSPSLLPTTFLILSLSLLIYLIWATFFPQSKVILSPPSRVPY